jgi:arylsulfatase A-like enzyme
MIRPFLATAFALCTMGLCGLAWAADAKRPNILFIYADDQPYKTLSCYPEAPDWVRTPHIDKLATHGVRFTRAYLGAWCMPSRASLLTGRLQHAIESMTMAGEYPGSKYDPAQCPFFPAVFRKHGYHTAQIGKWHTGTDTGYGRDWDYQIVWNRPAHPDNAGNYYKDQILSFNGQERLVSGYSTDNYTNWAVEYIEGKHRQPDKPWYLWLCYGAVHGPTTPAERHKGKYAGNAAPVPKDIFGPWPAKPAYLADVAAWEPGKSGKPVMKRRAPRTGNFDTDEAGLKYDDWVQQVNECAMAVDEGVARVMKALKDSGQLANTLVVYTADQGYALGEHGFSQKVAAYDATIASPLIISQPGTLPEGKVCKHPVNSPDLVTLFCDTAGIELPWKTHGRDMRPLLANPETAEWNTPTLLTHTGRSYGSETDIIPTDERLTAAGNTPWYALLRDGRYKYIRTLVEGETEELYDLEADPEELTNLATHPQHRTLLETLRGKTITELKRTEAGFVDRMPRTKAMAAR